MKDRRKVYTFILSEALKDENLPDFTVVHTIQSKVRNLHCNIYIAGQRLHAYGTIWGYEALFEELLNALSMQTWSTATTQTHLEIIPSVYGMQDHGIELRQLKLILHRLNIGINSITLFHHTVIRITYIHTVSYMRPKRRISTWA